MSSKRNTDNDTVERTALKKDNIFSACSFVALAGAIIYYIIGKPNRSVQKISQDMTDHIQKKQPWILKWRKR